MVAAWESERFVTLPRPPRLARARRGRCLLTPEWRKLAGKPLAEIVAEQWSTATRILLDDLEKLAAERWCVVDYAALVEDPQREVERLCEFAGIEFDEELLGAAAGAREPARRARPESVRSSPKTEIEAVLPRTEELAARARDWLAEPAGRGPPRPRLGRLAASQRLHREASRRSSSQLGGSLLVSTYQTGKLDLRPHDRGRAQHPLPRLRHADGPRRGTADGFAVGTRAEVLGVPQPARRRRRRSSRADSHDACFVPRNRHYTGDIRIHDIAFAGGELWIVATRFSCLATLDDEHSFVPRWRPPFITALAAEDRCHLNGLAVVDDQVRFVTALGETDEPGGWRENKASGGVLIDVESGETVLSGLSMPHSPRWHRRPPLAARVGRGRRCRVGRPRHRRGRDRRRAARLHPRPGVRRAARVRRPLPGARDDDLRRPAADRAARGAPLRRLGGQHRDAATIVGFLRFEDLVQEIFDVAILPGLRFPEIAEHGSDDGQPVLRAALRAR